MRNFDSSTMKALNFRSSMLGKGVGCFPSALCPEQFRDLLFNGHWARSVKTATHLSLVLNLKSVCGFTYKFHGVMLTHGGITSFARKQAIQ